MVLDGATSDNVADIGATTSAAANEVVDDDDVDVDDDDVDDDDDAPLAVIAKKEALSAICEERRGRLRSNKLSNAQKMIKKHDHKRNKKTRYFNFFLNLNNI